MTTDPTNALFAYDRGWNDPPSRLFSSTNANRKRIDPRKRVAHDLTSGAGFQPIQQQPPPRQPVPSSNGTQGYTNHFMPPTYPNMLPTNPGMLSHATSNPDLSNVITQLPAAEHHSTSMPFNLNAHEQNTIHNPPFAVTNNIPDRPSPTQSIHQPPVSNFIPTQPPSSISPQPPSSLSPQPPSSMSPQPPSSRSPQPTNCITPPQPSNCIPPPQPSNCIPPPQLSNCIPPQQFSNISLQQPLVVPAQFSSLPTQTNNEKSQDGRKLSAPNNNFSNAIFSQMTTPTMLQSSHLANKLSSLKVSTAGNQNVSTNGNGSTSPTSSLKVDSPPDDQKRKSPINGIVGPPLYSQQKEIQSKTVIGAPPTNGFYVSKVSNGSNNSSPKSSSPYSSIQNSPEVHHSKLILPNDSELQNEVVERLMGVCNKCSCVITSKVCDEINKKIQTFKTAWTSGKLSANVKLQISNLSQALDKREFDEADSIHKCLIVGHSSEVMPWIIGVKKLITSYQKVIEENNKY